MIRIKGFLVLLILFAGLTAAQRSANGRLHGVVRDEHKAVIPTAQVTIVTSDGVEHRTTTDKQGEFDLTCPAGEYLLRVQMPGFKEHGSRGVIAAEKITNVEVMLPVGMIIDTVIVDKGPPINTDPANNASAVVLGKDELKTLPDDPTELEAALRALAGPGSGPDGGELFIDGFSGGKLPRKNTIREVRINQNPFSSEFDRPGAGRIEILTKPGTAAWHGELAGEFEDESLNARNPFSPNRPPYQLRNGNGTISGPLIKNRLSSFTDLEREAVDNNRLVNAVVLGTGLAPTPFQRSFVVRTTNWDFGQRLDAQFGKNHTLVARFSRETFRSPHTAYGGFELPSAGWSSNNREWFIRLTETAVISPTVVNETRFQFFRIKEKRTAVDPGPSIQVLDAFISGGDVGNAFNTQGRHELNNVTSVVRGSHIFRTGVRIRKQSVDDIAPTNYTGTFTFTSLDQYRNTILNAPGAFPTQLTIAGGKPEAYVGRWDVGAFFQDDLHYRPYLTLSFGVRYERQNYISSPYDIAPRVAVAYAPGGNAKSPAKTVFRAGFGVYYDRFAQNLTLQATRFNGVDQLRFVVTDPAILDPIVFTSTGVTNIPTVQALTAFRQPQTTRVVSPDVRSPYTVQLAVSVERQFPLKTTISVSYINSHLHRALRSRNINAPVNGVRPSPTDGNVFQYESTGRFVQDQMTVNFASAPAKRLSLFGNYTLAFAKSDTDGAGTFPANSFDLANEFGPSSIDVRHRLTMGMDIKLPMKFELSPFLTTRSRVPFNITTGTDLNGDTLFLDRPAFATAGEAGAIATPFGIFDPTPEPGDVIIPRNFGRGPLFCQLNLNLTKTFHFGGGKKPAGDDDEDEGKYALELSSQIRNVINRVNPGFPIGNLGSTFFGRATSSAAGAIGNRRVVLEATFRF